MMILICLEQNLRAVGWEEEIRIFRKESELVVVSVVFEEREAKMCMCSMTTLRDRSITGYSDLYSVAASSWLILSTR